MHFFIIEMVPIALTDTGFHATFRQNQLTFGDNTYILRRVCMRLDNRAHRI